MRLKLTSEVLSFSIGATCGLQKCYNSVDSIVGHDASDSNIRCHFLGMKLKYILAFTLELTEELLSFCAIRHFKLQTLPDAKLSRTIV